MFTKKKYGSGLLCFILVLTLTFVSGNLTARDIPDEVMEAAQKGFDVFKSAHFNLDFCTAEEWQHLELGDGYQIFTVLPGHLSLYEYDAEQRPFFTKAIPTQKWRFFVKSNGAPIALIYVAKVNDVWTGVGIGSSLIAKEMDELIKTFPVESGYKTRFIRVYEAKSDLIHISKKLNDKFVDRGYAPLISARIAMDLKKKVDGRIVLINEDSFIRPLKSLIKKHLELNMNKEI